MANSPENERLFERKLQSDGKHSQLHGNESDDSSFNVEDQAIMMIESCQSPASSKDSLSKELETENSGWSPPPIEQMDPPSCNQSCQYRPEILRIQSIENSVPGVPEETSQEIATVFWELAVQIDLRLMEKKIGNSSSSSSQLPMPPKHSAARRKLF